MLSAARALQQINNQIQSLQNQAAMLTNMAKNLSRIDFSELSKLKRTLRETNRLMAREEGIEFDASQVEAQFRRLFPQGVPTGDSSEHIAPAHVRPATHRSAPRPPLPNERTACRERKGP